MLWPLRVLCRRSSREVLAPRASLYASFVSLALVLATVVGCGSENLTAPERTNGDPVFVGAGDIADCETTGDEATAELIANIDGTVFTLGDNAYPRGSAANFADCYEPTWGQEKHRTKPVPGNNDYVEAAAGGYCDFFGSASGDAGKGSYSYDLGTAEVVEVSPRCCLHIVVITGDGFGAVFLLAPGGFVTVGEVCCRSSGVDVIAQGEDRAVDVGYQLCRSLVA